MQISSFQLFKVLLCQTNTLPSVSIQNIKLYCEPKVSKRKKKVHIKRNSMSTKHKQLLSNYLKEKNLGSPYSLLMLYGYCESRSYGWLTPVKLSRVNMYFYIYESLSHRLCWKTDCLRDNLCRRPTNRPVRVSCIFHAHLLFLLCALT